MSNKHVVSAICSAIVAVSLTGAAHADSSMAPDKPGFEKCYGIAKKASNDCGAPGHACAGLAKQDGNPQEWMYLPTGLCKRIVGGQLQPTAAVTQKTT